MDPAPELYLNFLWVCLTWLGVSRLFRCEWWRYLCPQFKYLCPQFKFQFSLVAWLIEMFMNSGVSAFLKNCRTSGTHQTPVNVLKARLGLIIITHCVEFYSNSTEVFCWRTSRCFEKSVNAGKWKHSWKSQTFHW